MLDLIRENIAVFQLLASLTTTAVWIVYLNIFLRGFRQQRRSSLLINRGGGDDLHARCLISNMGAQPAYLLDVLACFEGDDGPVVTSIVDRKELRHDQIDRPSELTGQGPIASGSFVDIGSFSDVTGRAFGNNDQHALAHRDVKLVVVAATNQAKNIVAAAREFGFEPDGTSVYVAPRTIEARQIRSRRDRRRITEVLSALQTRSGRTEKFSRTVSSL